MLIVLPFCQKDKDAALRLLDWIHRLGANNWHHTALIVAAAQISRQGLIELMGAGRSSFGEVMGVHQNIANERGYPAAQNAMFRTALDYIEREACTPFLWCEPDCIPLVPDWLTAIEREYKAAGKPFMGAIHNRPHPHLAACAVYPPNYREFNPEGLRVDIAPWDLVASDKVLAHTHPTRLIQHVWGEAKAPPTFNGDASATVIDPVAVLFHRNKDGTLMDLIGKQLKIPTKPGERNVIVRRTVARGDAICASFVATRLQELGYTVTFQTDRKCAPWIRRIVPPLIVTDVDRACHINLDEAYETHPKKNSLPMSQMYCERALPWATKLKLEFGSPLNYAPRMEVTEAEKAVWRRRLHSYPRPWIMVCPRSQSHIRIVPDDIWQKACSQMKGTKFWLAVHGAAPAGIVDLKTNLDDAIIGLSVMDLLVTTDTGPMHAAAALGVPQIVIEQSFSPDLRLSDQRDWRKISPPLDCLNCQGPLCRKNNADPPCKYIDPELISREVEKRLRLCLNGISAVVPIYRPPVERLNKCLSQILPQVDEVIIGWDKAGVLPSGIIKDDKIRIVQSWQHDIGYARKANFCARHTNGRYLLFVNDDCYVEPDTVAQLRSCMAENVGIVGAYLAFPNGKVQHGGTWRPPNGYDWAHLDVNCACCRFTQPTEMEFVTGACILVDRKAFYEVGAHDEEFYLACDDSDLCARIRQAGYKVMFNPLAKGVHEQNASTDHSKTGCAQTASRVRLRKKWGWYFDKNRNNQLGTFA